MENIKTIKLLVRKKLHDVELSKDDLNLIPKIWSIKGILGGQGGRIT